MSVISWIAATQNKGKLKELQDCFSPYGVDLKAYHLDCDIEETGMTFQENAWIKARSYAHLGMPVLADDSGLMINALNGQPGVFSARWAGPHQDYEMVFEKLKEKLKGITNPQAMFVAVLCLYMPDQEPQFYEGQLNGVLIFPPRGAAGFGYDPIFIPQGYDKTLAEISSAEKNQISHRYQAVRQLIKDQLKSLGLCT